MSQFDFAKYRERLGYNSHNNLSCDDALLGVTPDTASNDLYNIQIPKYENNNGLLGGNRAYVESNGILIIFYKSRMFRKLYQGSCFINFNDVKSYKANQATLALVFNYGSLLLVEPNKATLNAIQSALPSKKESSKSFPEYAKYLDDLEDQASNSPRPNNIRP